MKSVKTSDSVKCEPEQSAEETRALTPVTVPSEESGLRWKITLYIFILLLAASCLGIVNWIVDLCCYRGTEVFLRESSTSSMVMFGTLTGVKCLVAVIEDIPVAGKLVEALSDLIDYSWWGCLISSMVLKGLEIIFRVIKLCGYWPAIIVSGTGCVMAALHVFNLKWRWLQKAIVFVLAVTFSVYVIAPLSVRATSIVASAIGNHGQQVLTDAKESLENAWTEENRPNYFIYYMAKIRTVMPKMLGGMDEETFDRERSLFEEKERRFKKFNRDAMKNFGEGTILYLSEKALACFLFPFGFLWSVFFFTKKICKMLDVPFNAKFQRLFVPMDVIKTSALRQNVSKLKTQISKKPDVGKVESTASEEV